MKNFKFPESRYEIRSNAYIQLDDVSFRYNESSPWILRNMNLHIDIHSKYIIRGPNGCGKSTLVKTLMGLLEPTSGEVKRNRKLRCAYFDQHEIAKLESDHTSIEFIQQSASLKEEETHKILSKFDIPLEIRRKPLKTLSGGEKARVVSSLIACQDAHVLVLDEPTNHLDLSTTIAFASAINSFPMAKIIITHNKTFLELLGDEYKTICL